MASFDWFENESNLRPWKFKLSKESWNFQTFKLYIKNLGPNFEDQKMKEKKTLIKRSRFKGHKKIEELRLQGSHTSMTDLSLHL